MEILHLLTGHIDHHLTDLQPWNNRKDKTVSKYIGYKQYVLHAFRLQTAVWIESNESQLNMSQVRSGRVCGLKARVNFG